MRRTGRRMRPHGSRSAALLFVAAAALVAAGCGGGGDGADEAGAPTTAVAAVEQALFEQGTTQQIECESLGVLPVSGVEREVVRCSFEQEESQAGEMRPRAGCFVADGGKALDVTGELPPDVTCFTSS